MKSSWFLGICVLFVGLQMLASVMSGGALIPATGGNITVATMTSWLTPTGLDINNPLFGIVSLVVGVWNFIVGILNAVFFNYPELFQGFGLYVKYFVFWPVSAAFVLSLVIVMRGSSNS